MTDLTNLTVTTGYMETLAAKQDQAANDIETATNEPDKLWKLWFDHGFICGDCVSAIEDMAEIRRSAGETMQRVSEELAKGLRTGAYAYDATDTDASDSLDQQMLSS